MSALNKGISVIAIVLAVWIALSYFEILAKNTRENPAYSEQNIFVMMMGTEENLK